MSFRDLLKISIKRNFKLDGIKIKIYDYITSFAPFGIYQDLKEDCYQIKHIPFKKDDIIIDIGANVGFFSIYLAKKFPFTKILAFEPIPDNYKHLQKNIKINNVTNVQIFNQAITGDGRDIKMLVDFKNSGGASAINALKSNRHEEYVVSSITLDSIFEKNNIKKCKLLKIDVEGAEYEILQNAKKLNQVEYLSAEIHINDQLKKQGYSNEKIIEYCKKFIDPNKISYMIMKT